MAFNARKTEHAGPKKGRGAFYGRKAAAKAQSNRRRRESDKREVCESVEYHEGVSRRIAYQKVAKDSHFQ